MDDISAVTVPSPEPTDQLLTVTEMAAKLRIGRNALQRLVATNTVPCVRIGARRILFRPEHFAEIAAMHEHRPTPIRGTRRRAS